MFIDFLGSSSWFLPLGLRGENYLTGKVPGYMFGKSKRTDTAVWQAFPSSLSVDMLARVLFAV